MAGPFSQTVIAVVWDFDKTLIPGNMQTPLFAKYGVDERAFWDEVDAMVVRTPRRAAFVLRMGHR